MSTVFLFIYSWQPWQQSAQNLITYGIQPGGDFLRVNALLPLLASACAKVSIFNLVCAATSVRSIINWSMQTRPTIGAR